ncbi:hypothetical protein Pla100_16510 [Neorhodopirellula pilleata]|uniref:Uncharacterized protein n=2 Tax=Neorhodopirellula pilleata TaxID=2714738 RepID=A0A5C6APK1_9BACT|nr:hypothetical protein Pla100_16510 [Neorhodopirellula pilleata]
MREPVSSYRWRLKSFDRSTYHDGSRTMRRSSLLIPFLFLLTFGTLGLNSTPLQADESSEGGQGVVDDPYLVFVAEETAHLRCGPSGEYYRTDPLRHGQELEVYVETAEGWLGVRPTDDSFCWIPAETVKLLNEQDADSRGVIRPTAIAGKAVQAEVIENKTVAWIGTNLGRARRYRWQVQLGEGEIVTILGSSERDGPDGPQIWYRIVPPSGEFRWIHRSQTVTTAEELIAGLRDPATTQANEPIEFLPAGPTVVQASLETDTNPVEMHPRPLRQVSDEQPESRDSDLSIDEIEDRIDARQRRRLEPLDQQAEIDAMPIQSNQPEQTGHVNHHPQSFSQRVTDGLSALINGRRADGSQSEPASQPMPVGQFESSERSSRRVPDLVPIGSGVVATTAPDATTAFPAASSPISPVQPMVTQEDLASSSTPKTVNATDQPGLRSNQSQVAFTSVPRLVTPANTPIQPTAAFAGDQFAGDQFTGDLPRDPTVATLGVPSAMSVSANPTVITPGSFPPPARTRTITAEQLDAVRQSVATAATESLPMELSKLMARGASAPEIAVVAEAAERQGNRELAIRARDYQLLARRRDGDTLIAGAALSLPPSETNRGVISQTSFTPIFFPPQQSVQPHESQSGASADQVAFKATEPVHQQSGLLVEVYSADPSRPPYAITDRGGRTIAYVTPAPGVDVKQHLGSEVRLSGESGYLQGLDTPHILAIAAERLIR